MSKTVLVVDDDDGVREIIQICLEAVAGWHVLIAASGEEGLSMAVEYQPDAILLDVMMPHLDGLATFKLLQANPHTKDIPTILLTAKAKVSEQQKFLNLGVTGIVTKPFEASSLVQEIKAIVGWE